METETCLFKNETTFNEKLAKRYVKSLSSNVTFIMIVLGIMLVFCLILAFTNYALAWIPVGLLVVCGAILIFINMSGMKNAKRELSKYYGAIYNYEFYSTHVLVNYNFQGKISSEDILYQNIRNVSHRDGLLAVIFTNNNLIFLDEDTVNDTDGYKKILTIFQTILDQQNKKKKQKK